MRSEGEREKSDINGDIRKRGWRLNRRKFVFAEKDMSWCLWKLWKKVKTWEVKAFGVVCFDPCLRVTHGYWE